MKVYQFAYTLGLSALVSLAISIGVTDYMLNQRDKAKEVVTEEHSSPEIKAAAERNKLLAEANVLIKQVELDAELSKYSGAKVQNAYLIDSIQRIKQYLGEAQLFCRGKNADLSRIKFYGHGVEPFIVCDNGESN